jgi:hypothetical protein
LDAAEDGTIPEGSYLLVESLDRISRDAILAAQGLFLQIIQAGIILVTLTDRRIYSADSINANPTDLIISLVSMMRAHEESAHKSSRLKAAWVGKRANVVNKPLTARCPAWLRLEDGERFEVIPERAGVIQRIYTMTAEGMGQHLIAERLNQEGVPCFGSAAHWHRSYVKKILGNPAVVGTLVPHVVEYADGKKTRRGLDAVEGYYPAVIDQELYDRVQAMRLDTGTPVVRQAVGQVANVLAGIGRCPLCGGTMTRVNKGPGGGRPYLVCTRAKTKAGCQSRAVPYGEIEQTLIERRIEIVETAPGPNAATQEIDLLIKGIEGSIDGQHETLERLVDAIAAGRSRALVERIQETEAEIERLNHELDGGCHLVMLNFR